MGPWPLHATKTECAGNHDATHNGNDQGPGAYDILDSWCHQRQLHCSNRQQDGWIPGDKVVSNIVHDQLSEEEQQVSSGLVKKNLEGRRSIITQSTNSASPPKAVISAEERLSVPVKEISRRMSVSKVKKNQYTFFFLFSLFCCEINK